MKKGFTLIEVLAVMVMTSILVISLFKFNTYINKIYYTCCNESISEYKRQTLKDTFKKIFDNADTLTIMPYDGQVEIFTENTDTMIFVREGIINWIEYDVYFGGYYVFKDLAVFTFYDKYGSFNVSFTGDIDEVYFN